MQVNPSEAGVPVCTASISVCLQTDLYDVHIFMPRTIGAIKSTQVKTHRVICEPGGCVQQSVSQDPLHQPSSEFSRCQKICTLSWRLEQGPSVCHCRHLQPEPRERLMPRATADYSQSLSYSLLLYDCANKDSQINLPWFWGGGFVGLVWFGFAVTQSSNVCFGEDGPECMASQI